MESNFLSDIQKAPFLFLQDHPFNYFKPIANTLEQTVNDNKCYDELLIKAFYSSLNIDFINKTITKTVYNNTCEKYIVTEQKIEHIMQIMDGIFHDYSQHLPFKLNEQIKILNKLVIDYCTSRIITEIEVRNNYLRDKFSPLVLLDAPISTSLIGSKNHSYNFKNKNYDPFNLNVSNSDNPENIKSNIIEKKNNINTNSITYNNNLQTPNIILDNRNINEINSFTDNSVRETKSIIDKFSKKYASNNW